MTLLTVIVVAIAVGLCAQLWQLQVVHGFEYAREAEDNHLKIERLKAPRGIVYGRTNKVVLADNRAATDVVLVPKECGDVEVTLARLAQVISIYPEGVRRAVKARKGAPYEQIVVKQDISKSELLRVEESSYALPGVYCIARPQRRYTYGKTGGQLLGYISEINDKEFKTVTNYRLGDYIGRSGLEKTYEDRLRGTDGQMCVSVYARGKPQMRTDATGTPYVVADTLGHKLKEETRYRRDPAPGKPIFTSLDMGLQAEAEAALADKVGAAAVLNADTGEVLALASSPGYDPSVFVSPALAHMRGELLTDKKMTPMRSRAFQSAYPPGSTFKVMLAIAGLEEGVIDRHTTFGCNGYFRPPGASRAWRCWTWKTGGHGSADVVGALAYSCDVYFYNVGLKLGPERINKWANALGLGVPSGIDLPDEAAGIIDSPKNKEARNRKAYPKIPSEWRWYPGDTVNLSIGQGHVTVTPLQSAIMMAAVVNGGSHVRPFINLELGPEVSKPLIHPETLKIVQEGMRLCVEDNIPPRGTGTEARIPGMIVIGKTGTAQVASSSAYAQWDTKEKEHLIPYALRPHAFFIAGVVDRTPHLAVSVAIEHGLHGGSAATPIARRLIEYFYNHLDEIDAPPPPAPVEVAAAAPEEDHD